jgi:hypothetical protein
VTAPAITETTSSGGRPEISAGDIAVGSNVLVISLTARPRRASSVPALVQGLTRLSAGCASWAKAAMHALSSLRSRLRGHLMADQSVWRCNHLPGRGLEAKIPRPKSRSASARPRTAE